ncbi:MAG: DUF368 domain-containing protein [Cyclobacteriaceae bacterium]|nr:DUF368 domain-containing protein [Cyclobacteriaceae bacterium]MCH8514856.1 DUF368 domain-containing protein [Cyclobacteriaceae bacterium]
MRQYLILFSKGLAMGVADLIPGVSGGTIAFITGIYARLIKAIRSVKPDNFKLLFKGDFKKFAYALDLAFLIPLVLGIATSIIALSSLITYLLANYEILVMSFFTGLIIISALSIIRRIDGDFWPTFISILIGGLLGFLVTLFSPAETTEALWFVFLSGSIAICAMILPGLSGSFILLLLGKYEYVVGSIKELDFTVIFTFAAGAIVGLLSFARLVSWLFQHHPKNTTGILAGIMLGALPKIWPWKQENGEGIPENVWPHEYVGDPLLLQALLCLAVGILLIVTLEKLAKD